MTERIWDKFLTEQDKQHLAATDGRRRAVGFGTKPALVIVDMYRGVFGDEPEPLLESVKKWPGSCGMAGWNALPYFQTLLAEARAAQIPIVHITMMDDAGVEGWSVKRGMPKPTLSSDLEMRERQLRRADIVTELTPLPGEAVLKKVAPSAFWGTPLAAHLSYNDVDTVIAVGESTSGCLRATVVEGTSHRFRMIVAEECSFDRHETAHAMNLFDMHQKYADVLPLDEVVAHLRTLRPVDDAVPSRPELAGVV
ncbi:MAG: isochorismatase family protein [Chloroflexota bacterium]